MMIDQTFTFVLHFTKKKKKKLHHIQVLTFDINSQSGSGIPITASTKACRFHRFYFYIPGFANTNLIVSLNNFFLQILLKILS